MRKVFLVGLLLAAPVLAQLPRTAPDGSVPFWNGDLRRYVQRATFARTVTVDATGAGDYSTLSAALAYVAAQSRADYSDWWSVRLMPGRYTSGAITIPAWTTVECATDSLTGAQAALGTSPCLIDATATTGAAIALDGDASSLIGVDVRSSVVNTGALTVVAKTGEGTSYLGNVTVVVLGSGSNPVTAVAVAVEGSTLFAADVGLSMPTAATTNVSIAVSAGGNLTLHRGRILGNSEETQPVCVQHAGAGDLLLVDVTLGNGCVVDLDNDGPGALVVSGTQYDTSSGEITPAWVGTETIAGPARVGIGSALPAACTPPSLMTLTGVVATRCPTPPCSCHCTAADTWRCGPLG
ncbi:MAG TPA: hypothetical protein VF017_15480 [Thermoanaerobaculia bacterium]|nr:hypothetical protein [Thermoanaerobaculia bacterium]